MEGTTDRGLSGAIELPGRRVPQLGLDDRRLRIVGGACTDPADDQDASVGQERCGMTLAAHLQRPGRGE